MIQKLVSSLTKDGLMIACGVVVLALLAFLTYASVFVKFANADMVNMITGQVIGLVGMIVGYYFGAAKSSPAKTQVTTETPAK